MVQFHSFTGSCPVSQHGLLKRLSSPHCMFLPPLSKINLTKRGFISGLSILFHCPLSIFVRVLYCFDDCSFVVSFEISEHYVSHFVFPQFALALQGLLWFHTNFSIIFSSSGKNTISILIGLARNL